MQALRHREFRIFWVAALFSNTGSWIQNTAIPYVAFDLTGRNGGVGVTGFFQYLPIMLMGAVGGSAADRFDRKRLLVVTQLGQAVCAAALWALVASGRATPTSLTALAFASGLAGGMNIPVWQSFVSELVPRPILLNAVTLNSTQFNMARALGTFLAGVIIAVWGASAAFGINAVSFGCVLVGLAMIPGRGAPLRREPSLGWWGEWRAGVRYVLGVPGIVSCCVAIVAVAAICSPLFSFLVASYGQELYDIEGWRLGLLAGSSGVGAVLLAPVILTAGERVPRDRLLAVAMTVYGLGTVAVGFAPHWTFAVVGLVVYGAAYLAIASAMNTTVQLLADEDMRGKSIAIYIMCLTGALPIGLFVWGFVADLIGIREVTVIAGVSMLVVTALLGRSGRFTAMTSATRPATR